MENLKFTTKLLICFFGLAIINAVIFAAISVSNAQKTARDHLRSNALSIATTAAEQVDGNLHEQIRQPGDESSEAYHEIESKLRKLRDANRRDDVHVAFIYTMRPGATESDPWVYVVDAEEPGDDKSSIGEEIVWEEQGTDTEEPLRLGEAYADQNFVTDEYGYWLSAYAPVRDSNNKIVAMLGVDFRANDVIDESGRVLRISLLGLAFTLVFTGLISVILSGWITKPLTEVVSSLTKIGRGHLEHCMDDSRGDEFGEINRAVNEMSKSLLERDALKGALSRYVSQEAVKDLVSEGEFPTFRGERRKMTILLCEIRNLESLSEVLSPALLVEKLNTFFDNLVGVIFKHRGTIDRLHGDGLTAVFGALADEAEQERIAVEAALELSATTDNLNAEWNLTGDDAFQLQIGVHTGEAIFGNIGADHRVEFTVVGKTMKIASALGQLNGALKTKALVSEATHDAIADDFPFVEIGDFQPDSGPDKIRLFTLKNLLPPEAFDSD